jgi:hypothetical protein
MISDQSASIKFGFSDKNIQLAYKIAAQSANSALHSHLYLNALALQVAMLYCRGLGLNPKSELADSSQIAWSLMTGSFDLYLPNLGSLECCAVLPGATHVAIAPESWGNRIGYLVVEVDELAQSATFLGFIRCADEQLSIPLAKLESIDALLDHLEALEQSFIMHSCLNQWLQNAELATKAGWTIVQKLTSPTSSQLAVRLAPPLSSSLHQPLQFKRSLSLARGTDRMGLFLGLQQLNHQKMGITLSLRPETPCQTLPNDLSITLTGGDDQVHLSVQPKTTDHFLVNFSGTAGDHFAVLIKIGDISYSESFEI